MVLCEALRAFVRLLVDVLSTTIGRRAFVNEVGHASDEIGLNGRDPVVQFVPGEWLIEDEGNVEFHIDALKDFLHHFAKESRVCKLGNGITVFENVIERLIED